MAEVLYRKWRPQSFAEVVGQDAVTRTLRNSVASGRLAHAYLLCGPRGTGKTTLGRLLAKAANCTAPLEGEPCNKCESCLAFIEGRAMDFVEQDAASHNSVEDIRLLRENVVLAPMSGGRKVYLLDEVHMLSQAAQNALLKTLEEPPPHIIFVLATTEAHKVQPTIMSRCQRFDLKRIPMTAAVQRMQYVCDQEGFTVGRPSLEDIARATTGSLRDGINALEQVVSYYGKSPTSDEVRDALGLTVDARAGELARLAISGDLTGGLNIIAAVTDEGLDMKQFSRHATKYLRGLLLAKAGAAEALELPAEMAEEVREEARKLDKTDILRALQVFGRIDWRDDHTSLPLELALVDYVSAVSVRDAAGAPPVRQPVIQPRRVVEMAPAPKPQTSIPAAGLETVEATITPADSQQPAAGVQTEETSQPEPLSEEMLPAVSLEAEGTRAGAHSDEESPNAALLDRVRLALKDSDKQLSALLNGSCEITSAVDGVVVLGFFHTFHLERIENSSFRTQLEKAFSDELGNAVKVAFQHAPRERPPNSERKGGHLVQAARDAGARAIPPGD